VPAYRKASGLEGLSYRMRVPMGSSVGSRKLRARAVEVEATAGGEAAAFGFVGRGDVA
jgi:hypothetical protein